MGKQKSPTADDRWRYLLQQMPGFAAVLVSPEHIFEYVNDAYLTTAGPRAFLGHSVRELFPELTWQGFYELLDQVYSTAKPYAARATSIRLSGEDRDRYIDLLYQPIRNAQAPRRHPRNRRAPSRMTPSPAQPPGCHWPRRYGT